jgi:cyclopropane-fatty-acyl-phospholipid synthase
MMDDLCQKSGIQDGETVLDIACGFGSLSGHILSRYPKCRVVALNLSQTQVAYIAAKQSEPGHPLHTERLRIIREDFSKFGYDRKFDRIFVIGLFEHIRNLRLALEKIAGLLKPDGTALLHYIAYNRIIRPMADPSQDMFFNRYIFPGGRFWFFNELPRYQEHLRIDRSWFLNGDNYMRTLVVWRQNFWRNIEKIRAGPGLTEEFVRTWDLYLRFCIAAFGGMGGRNLGNGQYLLRHATR